jgi:class I lanthipeptide synthase
VTWQPVLEGDLADAAFEAVRAIAEDIMVVPSARDCPEHLALFWAYATSVLDHRELEYASAVSALIARVERRDIGIPLYGGLAGAGWVLSHICDDVDELLDPIDAIVNEQLVTSRWRGHYDLIGGLAGLGVYFLERASKGSASARRGLDAVVGHLDALAVRAVGVTWHTSAALVPAALRAEFPEGRHDCGVAHGVPGAIAVLAHIAALADAPPRAAALCAEAISWLRSIGPPFPVWLAPNVANRPARTAWCYGDAGVAAALSTACAVDDWRELALACAARDPDGCGVVDAGLCHGAMGLAHLYNRFYQATADEPFRAASRTWYARGLAMRQPGRGIGGFTVPYPAGPVTTHDLLEGASGIGLALLAGLSREEPGWDRLLLADVHFGQA